MERLKFKKEFLGKNFEVSKACEFIMCDYITEGQYVYMLKNYPHFFESKKKKKNDKNKQD